jgi:hypothetical protein
VSLKFLDKSNENIFYRDLETLKQYKTRSPYSDVADSSQMLTVYRRGDVEKR